MSFARWALVVSWLLIGAAYTSAGTDQPRSLLDYSDSGRGINKSVPKKPLTRERLSLWRAIIGASDEQWQLIEQHYEAFLQRHNALMDREGPRYAAKSAELMHVIQTDGLDAVTSLTLRKNFDQLNSRLRREIISVEQQFIDSFTPILTEFQLDRASILRDEAVRRNCRTFWTSGRWAGVELREIWLTTAAPLATAAETEHVEVLLGDYERRLTDLVCRQADYELELRTRLAENRIGRNNGTIAIDVGRQRYFQMMARRGDLAKRVRMLHEQAVRQMGQVLRPAAAQVLIGAAKQVAFPELYPDATELSPLLDALLNDQLIDPETSAAIGALYGEYRATYSAACESLEAVCVEWAEQNESGIVGYEPQFLNAALAPHFEHRVNVSRNMMKKLHETIGLETLARHAALNPFKPSTETELQESPVGSGDIPPHPGNP